MSSSKHDFVRAGTGGLSVSVRDNNVDQALRVLKKKMQQGGVFGEMRAKRHFVSPGEQRIIDKAAGKARRIKLAGKAFLRDGFEPDEAKKMARAGHPLPKQRKPRP